MDCGTVYYYRCDGQTRCSLTVNDATFGGTDPCPNTGKYLEVIYLCIPGNCPYSIAERRVPELTPVLGSQPASDVSRKPGGKLPLLSARPAVTLATLKMAATSFAAW